MKRLYLLAIFCVSSKETIIIFRMEAISKYSKDELLLVPNLCLWR